MSDNPSEKSPYLSIAICTFRDEGIKAVAAMSLPKIEDVEYVVSWQEHEYKDIPEELAARPDVKVVRCNVPGLSNNRNKAVAACSGEIIQIADDDLTFLPEGIKAMMQEFRRNPELDLGVFNHIGPDANNRPSEATSLKPVPRFFEPMSIDMVFRRRMFEGERPLRFNPYFGLGASLFTAGEDVLVFHQAIKRGRQAMFFPINIVAHPGEHTGTKAISDLRVLHANGALLAILHPANWLLRLPINAKRIGKSGRTSALKAFGALIVGASQFFHRRREISGWF